MVTHCLSRTGTRFLIWVDKEPKESFPCLSDTKNFLMRTASLHKAQLHIRSGAVPKFIQCLPSVICYEECYWGRIKLIGITRDRAEGSSQQMGRTHSCSFKTFAFVVFINWPLIVIRCPWIAPPCQSQTRCLPHWQTARKIPGLIFASIPYTVWKRFCTYSWCWFMNQRSTSLSFLQW